MFLEKTTDLPKVTGDIFTYLNHYSNLHRDGVGEALTYNLP